MLTIIFKMNYKYDNYIERSEVISFSKRRLFWTLGTVPVCVRVRLFNKVTWFDISLKANVKFWSVRYSGWLRRNLYWDNKHLTKILETISLLSRVDLFWENEHLN